MTEMAQDEYSVTFDHTFELWINPEIERRRAAGTIPADFVLTGAQVIFDLDLDRPVVRLNKEIKAVAQAVAARALEANEKVTAGDLSAINEVILTDHDPNAGHVTVFRLDDNWVFAFDLRYNAAKVTRHVGVGREFLRNAVGAHERGDHHVCVDLLFSAVELIAMGFLIAAPVKPPTSHSSRRKQLKAHGDLGNIDARFVKLLDRLWSLRPQARYLEGDFDPGGIDFGGMLAIADEALTRVEASIPKRASVKTDER